MKIDLVIVNFFTERKKVISFSSPEERLESALNRIGKAYSESVLVAYHEGQEVLAHRPVKMMQEKEEVQAGNMDPFEFMRKWKVFLGHQTMPDLTLPKKKAKKVKKVENVEENLSPEDLAPSRASFPELIPSAAGI